jgi:Putative collagen-binding domain of a collagenase
MSPHDELITSDMPTWCLAEPGQTYLIYTMHGGPMELNLNAVTGSFSAQWFDPRTGELTNAHSGPVDGGTTREFGAPDKQDWGLLLTRQPESGRN